MRRKTDPRYNEDLWNFVDEISKRPLQNLPDTSLQFRLIGIDKNIQFLDVCTTGRDKLSHNRGWLSPWWWLQQRFLTVREFERRALEPLPTESVDEMPAIHEEFVGAHGGGSLKLFRVSHTQHLIDTVERGKLRFAPASSYKEIEDDARADDELRKHYMKPGQHVTITRESGEEIGVIGDVTHSFARDVEIGGRLKSLPYWLTSYSSDLDPRLLFEFPSAHADDAFLAIFDVETFLKRTLKPLCELAPYAEKKLVQLDYFDPYFPSKAKITPIESKDMRFAYQREVRMTLDPGLGPPITSGDALFVDVGSLADIAAVYSSEGERLTGWGPKTFFK